MTRLAALFLAPFALVPAPPAAADVCVRVLVHDPSGVPIVDTGRCVDSELPATCRSAAVPVAPPNAAVIVCLPAP